MSKEQKELCDPRIIVRRKDREGDYLLVWLLKNTSLRDSENMKFLASLLVVVGSDGDICISLRMASKLRAGVYPWYRDEVATPWMDRVAYGSESNMILHQPTRRESRKYGVIPMFFIFGSRELEWN